MKIVLLGYMGSGKSVIGSRISVALDYQFIDLDVYISQEENCYIPELFANRGEIYFRKKEKEIITELLNQSSNLVISLGGGTPCYSNIIEQLNRASNIITIYLKASIKTLVERNFSEKNSRPLISHLTTEVQLEEFIAKHLFERSFYYNQAKHTVDCNDKTIDEVVEDIILTLF